MYDTGYFILLWKIPHKWPKKARYHDAVYDTCYFILLWKIPHKWPKKDRYHDAVNDTCDNTSLVKCLQTFAQKKVQYHNAVNDTRYLILFWEYPTETIKKARYHDAVYDTCHFILVWKIPQKWPKKARYHDAVYDTCYFILLWKIPHKWPKKRSVPWCCKWHMWQYFTSEMSANVCNRARCHHVLDVKNRTVWVQDHKMSYRDTLQKLLCVKASVYESVCVCKSICV